MEGAECNVCREGSFYLDPANPKGCTSCFCFGINNHCHSTHKRRAKVCKEWESFCFYLVPPNEEGMNWHEAWRVMEVFVYDFVKSLSVALAVPQPSAFFPHRSSCSVPQVARSLSARVSHVHRALPSLPYKIAHPGHSLCTCPSYVAYSITFSTPCHIIHLVLKFVYYRPSSITRMWAPDSFRASTAASGAQ